MSEVGQYGVGEDFDAPPHPPTPLGEREKNWGRARKKEMVGHAHPAQHRRDAGATKKSTGWKPALPTDRMKDLELKS